MPEENTVGSVVDGTIRHTDIGTTSAANRGTQEADGAVAVAINHIVPVIDCPPAVNRQRPEAIITMAS